MIVDCPWDKKSFNLQYQQEQQWTRMDIVDGSREIRFAVNKPANVCTIILSKYYKLNAAKRVRVVDVMNKLNE